MDFIKRGVLIFLAAMATSAVAEDFNAKSSGEYVPNELIIKFKQGQFQTASILQPMQGEIVKTFRASGAHLVRFPKVVDVKQMAQAMSLTNATEYVELNQIYHLNAIPNDPNFEQLYGLNNEGKTGGSTDADIDAPEAWDISTGSREVLVGVIDTGVDYTHPDLVDNMWTNPGETGVDENGADKSKNGIDDDQNGYIDDFRGWDFINGDNDPMDGHSHGTHVSGTIGAAGNNGVGVVGVNWEVSIVGLKIFSDAGSTTADAIISAIEYSTKLGVRVTNNSWGGGGFSQPLMDAIAEANEAGIFFIAAAGNSRNDNDARPYYPASYELENIITVAATDHADRLASFSSYGAKTVDVAAPGVDVFSTVHRGRYQSMSGTSMATPHVTGLMALVMAAYPDATFQELRDRVVNTGDVIPSLNNKVISGARINAHSALENDTTAPSAPTGLEVTQSGMRNITLAWDISGDDGREGLASAYDVRISETPIDETSFGDAQVVAAKMGDKVGDRISAELSGLPLNFKGYVAIRAIDNVGNVSAVSETIEIQTAEVQIVFQNMGDTLDGFTADAPWGVKQVDGNSMLSDSPSGSYASNANTSLTSRVMDYTGGVVGLSFDHAFQTESNYDFVHIEISVNGGEWRSLARFSGDSALQSYYRDITSNLSGASTFQIRFRLQSDSSANRDGWDIDNITIIQAQ